MVYSSSYIHLETGGGGGGGAVSNNFTHKNASTQLSCSNNKLVHGVPVSHVDVTTHLHCTPVTLWFSGTLMFLADTTFTLYVSLTSQIDI